MANDNSRLLEGLRNLVGLRVTSAGFAASMRTFTLSPTETRAAKSPTGEWALHIDCPWRIESAARIVTGSSDWSQLADPNLLPQGDWEPSLGGSLQDARLRELFEDQGVQGERPRNRTAHLVVTGVEVDVYGGVVLELTGGYRLRAFPTASRGEHWRIFDLDNLNPHVVCSANRDD